MHCYLAHTYGVYHHQPGIGDSITAGVHSEGTPTQAMTYPAQLGEMLNKKYPNKYKVTNLGACGSTMMKGADSPYWQRPQFKALTAAKWDIIIIMLGTIRNLLSPNHLVCLPKRTGHVRASKFSY